MAKTMKTVGSPATKNVLVVEFDPLRVGRGVRLMRRGGVHQTARRPSRAQAKRGWRREAADGSGARRSRSRIGQLV
jgi:hypothetical protein